MKIRIKRIPQQPDSNENAAKWHAFGGELGTNGTDWTNGLLYVDNGGTHEQNPLGGIPVGFDQNGTPNLVEEGETIWNDYVFSNRIKVPKAMFHTLGLGGAMKKNRLTFADASKKLAKESEQRPNDPISMAGLEASLSKLAAVQEAERMKKQMRESVGLENMAAYGGSINSFPDGGSLKWLKKNHPEIKHIEEVAKAMDRYIEQHPSRIKMKGDVVPYMNAYSLIAKGSGNLLTPRRMPAESSPVSNSKITTGIIYGNEPAREQHFRELRNLGLSEEAALDFAYPEPELKKSSNPSIQSANEVDYAEQMDRRNRFQERMLSDEIDRVILPEAMNPEYVDKYSKAHKVIQNLRGISTPILTINPDSSQPATQNNGVDEFLAAMDNTSTLPSGESLASVAQRNNINNGANSRAAGDISSGTGYSGTPGVRGGGNAGVVGNRNGINPYAYDNSRWDEFEYYNPQTRQYDEGYLNFARNINQDWVDRILKGTYGDMSRYLSRNSGYQITPQEVGNLATDELYSDMHKAMQAAYKEYLAGIDPVTGEKRVTNPYEVQTPDTPAAEGEVSKVPADAVNGEPQAASDATNTGTNNNPVNEKRPLLDARLRYAPVVGGALGVFGDLLGLTNKPDYTYADKLEAAANAAGYAPQVGYKPIGEYMRYTPFDRLFYANQLQANARGTDRMLANTSSPARNAALLANAQNTNNALGNLYRQGDESNLAQYQQMKNFNIKSPMFNSQMGLEAEIANARYGQAAKQYKLSGLGQAMAARNAIDQTVGAARSANLTNFFNSLGNIGRENFTFNQINQDPTRSYIYQTPINGGWGYVPKFMEDAYQKDVESAAQRMLEEERKKNAEAQKATQSASGAYGGKLKRNKK